MTSQEKTLSIIKPDGITKNIIGEIYKTFEEAGLKIVAAKMLQLTHAQACAFYSIHKDRPFFADLVRFMTSGPVMVQVLEGPDAVLKNRALMGATNPQQALAGTLRARFADSIDENVVHGSDSVENADIEIRFFFEPHEIHERTR